MKDQQNLCPFCSGILGLTSECQLLQRYFLMIQKCSCGFIRKVIINPLKGNIPIDVDDIEWLSELSTNPEIIDFLPEEYKTQEVNLIKKIS